MTSTKVNVNKVMADATLHVTVTGLRVFGIRSWFATKLMVLAEKLLGCKMQVHYEDY